MNPEPSRPRIAILRNVALVIGGFFFAQFSYNQLRLLVQIDPFKGYRDVPSTMDPNVAIQFDNVELRHYSGAELVAKTKANRVAIWHDQQTVELSGVHDGVYRTKDALYRFDANKAFYIAHIKQLRVEKDAHVVSKDFDLVAKTLEFDGNQQLVDIKTGVKGRLKTGRIEADSLHYGLKGGYSAKKIHYVGNVDFASIVQDAGPQRTRWDVHGEEFSQPKGSEIESYLDAHATDGDVIIIAPRIERNVKTEVITATGRVKYFSGKANLIADKVVVNRKEKRAILSGHVQMLVKPKKEADLPPKEEVIPPFLPVVPPAVSQGRPAAPAPDLEEMKKQDEIIRSGKNVRDFPMSISCDKIDYVYAKGRRRALIEGNPQAHQNLSDVAWRRVWCKSAIYDGEAETLELMSSKDAFETRMVNSIGDDMTASRIKLSTQEGDDSMTARSIKGTTRVIEDGEIERDKKKKSGEEKKGSPPPGLSGKIG